jgi:hypothetical protein
MRRRQIEKELGEIERKLKPLDAYLLKSPKDSVISRYKTALREVMLHRKQTLKEELKKA